tara:strand:+ start:739 stop:1599 length:861 start_codon:yes stop_codon:yes gene_type:complete
MTTPFDFSTIEGLNTFWDGSADAGGWGGGQFNTHTGQAGINANLDNLYQGLLGRNADTGGRNYWGKEIASGAIDYLGVANAIKASKEGSGQTNYLSNNPNATAADLKSLPNAYISPFHKYSGSAAAGWTPDQPMTLAHARAAALTESNADGSQKLDADGNYIPKGSYDDQTRHNPQQIWNDIISGDLQLGGGQQYEKYDDSGLLGTISGLRGELGTLKSAFDDYKKDMDKMWANANWGSGTSRQQSTVQGVKTQNELPGWTPKTGGSTGFFGRGSGFGLTTGSLNI